MQSPGTLHQETLADRMAAIVGARYVLTEAADMAPHLTEWRDLYQGRAAMVVKPGTTEEVAAVVRLAAEAGAPVVPQGGNTGLVGGQTPFDPRAVVVSLTRLDRIRSVDAQGNTLVAEAGVTLAAVQEAANGVDRLFPLSLASEGTCQIGGNLSSNAGGTAVLAYGNARDLVLGLEVVLADGRIWNGLRALRKDNTGYDLKHLFIGAEGTLGIITAAVLKLYPKPKSIETIIAAVPDPEAGLALLSLVRGAAGTALTTFELIPRIGFDYVLDHMQNVRDPLTTKHDWYVLAELTSGAEDGSLRDLAESVFGQAIEDGLVEDAVFAESLDQRDDFWRLRESLPEAQRYEGGSIKHDVSVPVADFARFMAEATEAVQKMVPGCRPVAFGHVGDGNIHFNVSQPVGADSKEYLARWGEMNELVHAIALRYGGSISAEHGIGLLKRHMLEETKSAVEFDLMRRIKKAFDPDGILNPGKLV